MFVVPAQMILKLGIASVALVGSMLLMNGTLTLITFFMFLLVVSRIYEPMSFSTKSGGHEFSADQYRPYE